MTRNRSVALWPLGAVAALVLVVAGLCYYAREPAPATAPLEEDGLPGGAAESERERARGRAPELYPEVAIADLAKWVRPRATIRGTVTYVKHENDGDWHWRVEDGRGGFAVVEMIPELPLGAWMPEVGDKIFARGVVRWDGEHKWPELHPCTGWGLDR